MDPVAPVPEPENPRLDSNDPSLDPADSSLTDTPEHLSATGDFHLPPARPLQPYATLTAGDSPTQDSQPSIDSLRLAVPGYEIISELGRGGMGVVYLARQIGLNRAVALKMILSGEHAGTSERDRFRREAEAVAALQHSNIVQIYDVGESQGRPYLAFEYIGGGTLAGLLTGQPWPAKPAADLIEAIARAMQYAHDRGIVHRDLKPANVLLTAESGIQAADLSKGIHGAFRVPHSALKITDFGLAKRVDPDTSWSGDSERTAPAVHTRTGAVIGTPSYLAPEQAAGKNRLVGPHTDIYALGAILYELLTGRPPFRGETALDTVLQVMADDPVPPSKLRAKLPRDLETICLKCLQKDPIKRYETAGELADDLRRFQKGESITARPVSRWERGIKWMNRHPAASVLVTTSITTVALLLGLSLYYNFELRLAATEVEEKARTAMQAQAVALAEQRIANEERLKAEQQKAAADKARLEAEAQKLEAERGVYALQLFKAAALGERDPQRALRLLDNTRICKEELRDFTWRYIRGQCLVTEQVIGVHQGANGAPPVSRIVHSPDGKRVATVSGLDPMVRIYDVEAKRLLFVLAGHKLAVHGVAFAADGRTVATAGGDNTVMMWILPNETPTLAKQLAPAHTLSGHTNSVNAVTFSPDGLRLASAGADGLVRLWDYPTQGGVGVLKLTSTGVLKNHAGTVWALAWSDEGLFSGGSDGRVLKWELSPGGGKAVELFKMKKHVLALVASHDGNFLAAAGNADPDEDEPVIQLYRPLTDRKAGVLRGHTGLAINDLAFSPDSKRLVSGGRDGTVRLWDIATLQERAVFRPEKEPRPSISDATRAIRSVSFGTDGLSVVSGGQDGAIRLWNFSGQREEVVELDVRAPLTSAAISADGNTLVVGEKISRLVKVWKLGGPTTAIEPEPSRTLAGLDQPPLAVASNDDGSIVVAATATGVYLWRDDEAPTRLAKVSAYAVAIHGNDLVLTTDDGQLQWLDLRSGRTRFPLTEAIGRLSIVEFSPDGKKLVSAGGTALQIWDTETGEMLFGQVLAHPRRISGVSIQPGDTAKEWAMAIADEGGQVKVWEIVAKPLPIDGKPHPSRQALVIRQRPSPAGLNDPIGTLAFTADGRTLASAGVDRSVRLRDPETGQERAALAGHSDVVLLVAFRSDRVLLSVGREGVLRAWRAAK